jgi:hypothetical protein
MDGDHKRWLQAGGHKRRTKWKTPWGPLEQNTVRTELTRFRHASQITAHGGATGDEDGRTVTRYFLFVGKTRESGILSKRLKRVCLYVCRILHAIIILHDSIYN